MLLTEQEVCTGGYCMETRVNFVLDQSVRLFTFSLSTNQDAGKPKLSTKQARKYRRLLALWCKSILTFLI